MKNRHGRRTSQPDSQRTLAGHANPPRCIMQRHQHNLRRFGLILATLAALAGCGSGDKNNGYGYYYDAEGASGLRVRWASEKTPSLADIEQLYQETMECTGLHATGPLVIITPEEEIGRTFLYSGTILIPASIQTWPISTGFWTYKHEFIHYLLHQNGFDVTANADHLSPLFYTCVLPPAS